MLNVFLYWFRWNFSEPKKRKKTAKTQAVCEWLCLFTHHWQLHSITIHNSRIYQQKKKKRISFFSMYWIIFVAKTNFGGIMASKAKQNKWKNIYPSVMLSWAISQWSNPLVSNMMMMMMMIKEQKPIFTLFTTQWTLVYDKYNQLHCIGMYWINNIFIK